MEFKKVKEICKLGLLDKCCSYLASDVNGFCCLKTTTAKSFIDRRRAKGTINAKGDNCFGYDNDKKEYIEYGERSSI